MGFGIDRITAEDNLRCTGMPGNLLIVAVPESGGPGGRPGWVGHGLVSRQPATVRSMARLEFRQVVNQ
ncbi:hypothetical protein KRMM14A1259_66980 [Krasilnikovia sp. MM14-A1259]